MITDDLKRTPQACKKCSIIESFIKYPENTLLYMRLTFPDASPRLFKHPNRRLDLLNTSSQLLPPLVLNNTLLTDINPIQKLPNTTISHKIPRVATPSNTKTQNPKNTRSKKKAPGGTDRYSLFRTLQIC